MTITEIIDAKMPSLTEWLEKIGYGQAAEFRAEDNSKRDRLEILFKETGLIYDRPERLTARDIVDNTPLFQDIVARKGEKHCALRLVPTNPDLPKLRQRGKTLNEYLNGWFKELKINPDDYKAEVVPHGDTIFSCIFVVTDKGAWGEVVPGGHWKLTQGLLEPEDLMIFSFDFDTWKFSTANEDMAQSAKTALKTLRIDKAKQNLLKEKIGAEFTDSGYLKGYFEYIVWPEDGVVFVDYNRLLYKMFGEFNFGTKNDGGELTGICASPGVAKGKIKIVLDPKNSDFQTGEILACPMTMVDYVPLMQKAAGIITEQGNILSHAAIVSRELGKPCLVGVKNATTLLKNGDLIELDAGRGVIKIL